MVKYLLVFIALFAAARSVGQAYTARDRIAELKSKPGDLTKAVLAHADELQIGSFASRSEWLSFLNQVGRAALEENTSDLPEVLVWVGWRVQDEKEFEQAYFFFYKALHLVDDQWAVQKQIAPKFFEYLGLNYYHFRRFSKAEGFLKKALSHPLIKTDGKISVLNTLGLIARDLKQLSTSRVYTQRALALAKELKHDSWIGVLSGNLGYLYFLEGKYRQAKQLFLIDLAHSRENNEEGSWYNALRALVELELKLNNPSEADRYMVQLNEYWKRSTNKDLSARKGFHKTYATYLQSKQRYQEALENYLLHTKLKDSSAALLSLTTVQNTEFQIDFEARQAELSVLKEKEKKQRSQLLALVFVLVTIVGSALILLRQLQKRKRQEVEVVRLQKLQVERELETNEKEMRRLLSTMGQKNDLIDNLRSEIAFIQENQDLRVKEEKERMLENLQQFTLLTEEDWIEFKKLFEKMHPGFFLFFQENHGEVTNAEIRLAALLKLNLSNFEMAKTLGISPESVRKTNLRLRKKLGIESQEDLASFVKQIN